MPGYSATLTTSIGSDDGSEFLERPDDLVTLVALEILELNTIDESHEMIKWLCMRIDGIMRIDIGDGVLWSPHPFHPVIQPPSSHKPLRIPKAMEGKHFGLEARAQGGKRMKGERRKGLMDGI
jgi:hypothetical protein